MYLCSEATKFSLELAVGKHLRDGILNRGGAAVVALGLCADAFLEAELLLSMYFSL